MKTASDCRTKEELNCCHSELTDFLLSPLTIQAIGKKCVDAAHKLQNNLFSRQDKFGGYMRHGIKWGMGAMTTSPAAGRIGNVRKRCGDARTHMYNSVKCVFTRCTDL